MRIILPEWLIGSVLYTVAPICFALQFSSGVYAQCCMSTNMLESYNWDFSAPFSSIPSGFTNDNTYSPVPVGPGVYTIIRFRNWGACSATPQYDHTTGDTSGRYLWFDTPSAWVINPIAWTPYDPSRPSGKENLIDVQPNTDYVFSVWVRDLARSSNCISGGAPIAALRINGTLLDSIDLGAFTDPCCPEWKLLCTQWNSGNNVTALLQIESRTPNGYTDLGIDDVMFGPEGASQQAQLGNDTTICEGEIVTIDLSGISGNIFWNDGNRQKIRQISASGRYWLLTSSNSCLTSDTINIEVISPNATSGLDSVIYKCPDDEVVLSISNHPTIQWNTGASANNIIVSQQGTYWVRIAGTCYDVTDTIHVIDDIEQQPIVLPSDSQLCAFSYFQLPNLKGDYTYSWSTGDTTPKIEIDEDIMLFLTISDRCFEYDYSMDISTRLCHCELYIPNAFTPNLKDDINSTFQVYLSDCEISNFDISIFDRWGDEIFTSDKFNFEWDGTANGTSCKVDVYVYSINYDVMINRKIEAKNRTGHIYLLR